MTHDRFRYFDTPEGLAWANAIDAGDLARLRLLAAKSDPNRAEASGMTPLHWALLGEHRAAFAELTRLGAKPRPETAEEALLHPSSDFARALPSPGFDPAGNGPGGDPWIFTPLLAGNRANFRLLVERGAPVNAARADGTTPLIALATLGEFEDAFWLLERGADPSARTSTGATLASRTRQATAMRADQTVWRQRVDEALRFRGFE